MGTFVSILLGVIALLGGWLGIKYWKTGQNEASKQVINQRIKDFFKKKEDKAGEKSLSDSIDDFNKLVK